MYTEIEAKIKVDELESYRQKLIALRAEFAGQARQCDTYFDDANKSIKKSDSGFRLRCQTINDKTTAILCFKGPRQLGPFKNRSETEVLIDSADNMIKILNQLGYQQKRTVAKTRDTYQLNDALICLDNVDQLGCFIEIEAPSEKSVHDNLLLLGLDPKNHISKGYARLLADKVKED
ncbi:MAG: class IV adenylate cyclase [Phycisphaerae bacterium]|nr:class IV adenylate cyclase [Phycisphaerae bacterium]